MASKSEKNLKQHAQRYIRAVMAEQLRKEGFVSKNGEDISWYRVINGKTIHAIYFFTRHKQLPMFLNIGYGCHPLFITPEFPQSPYFYAMPGNEVIYPRYPIIKHANQFCYSDDILISCPADEYKGSDILENVFLDLQEGRTERDCYELHKKWRSGAITNDIWFDVSPQFVDEVIYWNDEKLFSYCKNYIIGRTGLLEKAKERSKLGKKLNTELEYLQILKSALNDGKREVHLQLLAQRKLDTVRLLNKHTEIQISI